MAVNLTTKLKVKTFMGLNLDDSAPDDLLDLLIEQVGRQIAAHCDRTFELTTYKRWFDGNGSSRMRLPEFPIDRLYAVSLSDINVGTLTYTGSGEFATATNDGTRITLVTIVAGAETITDITLSSNATITALETAIEAISDWSVSIVSGKGNEPSTLLRPFSGWVKSTDDADLDIPDESADARITSEGEDLIELVRTRFPTGRSNVFVWWKAGYTLPDEEGEITENGTVPQGLELIANQVIANLFNFTTGDADPTMKSEKLGDYSYTVNADTVNTFVLAYKKELWPWCKKHI